MKSPCGCPDLRSADPEHQLPASDEEQVLMVVEVGLVAAMLDDAIPDSESSALVTAIRLLPGLRNLSDEEVNLVLSRAGTRTREGDSWLCEVSRRLTNPGLRRVAFRMASMFCAWDGVIDDKEQGYLNFLAKVFEFSPGEADALFAQATGHGGRASVVPPALETGGAS
jgi:tellurite resistance protein